MTKRTFLLFSQLVAFYDYNEKESELTVTLKDGNRYLVKYFTKTYIDKLNAVNNKGAHILHEVFKNKIFNPEKLAKLSAKNVQEIVQEQYNKRNYVNRFRPSDEGWSSFLSR